MSLGFLITTTKVKDYVWKVMVAISFSCYFVRMVSHEHVVTTKEGGSLSLSHKLCVIGVPPLLRRSSSVSRRPSRLRSQPNLSSVLWVPESAAVGVECSFRWDIFSPVFCLVREFRFVHNLSLYFVSRILFLDSWGFCWQVHDCQVTAGV